jgi:cbb3-type cytochrome oxidase maturation protein
LAVAIALFIAGIAMGIAGALMWAWAVHSGQLRDLERTKHQLFWPEIAETPSDAPTPGHPSHTEAR